jgi:hypothetical protein
MKYIIIIGLAILASALALPNKASTTDIDHPIEETALVAPFHALPEREKLDMELWAIATAKGLPEAKIRQIEVVIGGNPAHPSPICPNGESNWDPSAIGDNGDSAGLVQINAPAHPEITREQALNPTFALNFIVDEFLSNNEWKWTCYKAYFR